jgi:branched-chain amino acid transport system ATP-binding protein
MALLEVKNLQVSYGEVQVLWDASFAVAEGSLTALIGSNGAGKTTTLKTILGLQHPKGGEILFEGQRIDGLASHRIVERGLALIMEGGRPFPEMTVRENLDMGAYVRRARRDAGETIGSIFDLFPVLRQRQNQLAGTLSGGERQMLAISRAVVSRPRLLMLDEPSLGLAPKVVETMLRVIQDLNQKGITILLVEQNIQHTLQIADHAYVMETGRITLDGGPELREHEHIKRAYLGV